MCHYVILWRKVIIKSNRFHPRATTSWTVGAANLMCFACDKKHTEKQDVLPDILDFANWVQEKNSQYGWRTKKKTIDLLENFVKLVNYRRQSVSVACSICVILDHCTKCQSSLNNEKLIIYMRVSRLSLKGPCIERSLCCVTRCCCIFIRRCQTWCLQMSFIWRCQSSGCQIKLKSLVNTWCACQM